MNLIEDAVVIELFGIRLYAYGAYVCLGALCALITLAILCRSKGMKPGTAPLVFCLSAVCGVLVSRVFFCLTNRELGFTMPFHSWTEVSGGGWSLFGLLAGVFLGGALCAALTRQKTGRIMDLLSVSVLPLLIAERIGENRIDYFDISRPLSTGLIADSFLAVGEYDRYLATYYVAAAVYLVLFVVLLLRLVRNGRDGNTAITFLLLFGAASIILESLRSDQFLSFGFVKAQQVSAALMLGLGVILAVKRSNRPKSVLSAAALISIPVVIGAVIGLEFALDRTTWNKILIYAVMIAAVSVPVALSMNILKEKRK